MTLITGEITEIFVQDFATCATVRVGGSRVRVPLMLLPDAKVGDVVLVSAGVAISKIVAETSDGERDATESVPAPEVII